MKVICAGAMKTGTKTMAKALRELGYTVYDSPEQIDTPLVRHWYDYLEHNITPDFREMFKGVDAVTDIPGCYFFEELLVAFPDAKVVLTVREEDSWARSASNQLQDIKKIMKWLPLASTFSPTHVRARDVVYRSIACHIGSENPEASSIHRRHFRMHNDRVKKVVPEDQLLVFEVTQGWKPLCDFLGHAIPKQPFPHENIKGQGVKALSKKWSDLSYVVFREWLFGMSVSIGALAMLGYFAYSRLV